MTMMIMMSVHQELEDEPLPDVAQLNAEIEAATKAENAADFESDKRKWRERREDLMRLKRVEQVYV
jgi:hypothetical protein